MKTQGIEIHDGYLVHRGVNDIPEPFWSRLKHAASKRQLADRLSADYGAWSQEPRGSRRIMAEHLFFKAWVSALFGGAGLWPWERGWTDELVDAYLSSSGTGG